ncbi:glycosyltransferase family 4 protein [Salinicoccus roseus]|uniref:glycosyltransferase family 4 protein n=1 Tax=Salinicoccus roseus TaxID=45670 RepID=UPI001CA7495B|nr:glycosyltransferase family 4 protein [Salinicoccus roseus]MBY8908361.1 glycosyltransferase family 4 protein [Salinicoccus roseus]
MKILYIATSFPQPHKGATIYTDLAEELYSQGHDIIVAVSEQRKNKAKTSFNEERGFPVLRIVVGDFYDVNIAKKAFVQLRMPQVMKRALKKYLKDYDFDLILFESPPVTNVNLVSWAMKRYKSESYLMLKDIFPQNAVDLGIIKKINPAYTYYKNQEKKLYKTPTYIGCMSEGNLSYIKQNNPWLDEDKLDIFPNTKKVGIYKPRQTLEYRNKLGIPESSKVVLFGGNMGKPQYIEGLAEILKKFVNDEVLYFLFVGRGTERYILEETIKKYRISNAKVIENLPRDSYEKLTQECDIGLISLHPNFTIPNYPSRILSYMEYAMPILALTDKNTDIKELITNNNLGYWAFSGDTENVVTALKNLKEDHRLNEMGHNGRKYLENNLKVKRSVEILESHFS